MNTEKFIAQLISDHTEAPTIMGHVQISVVSLSGVLRSISRNTGDPRLEKIADELRTEFFKKLNPHLDEAIPE